MQPGAALLLINRTTTDAEGDPFEYSHDLFRGDRMRVIVRWFAAVVNLVSIVSTGESDSMSASDLLKKSMAPSRLSAKVAPFLVQKTAAGGATGDHASSFSAGNGSITFTNAPPLEGMSTKTP